MKDGRTIEGRLAQLRDQLLNWGVIEHQAVALTKDELRGWIRALEWVLGPSRKL